MSYSLGKTKPIVEPFPVTPCVSDVELDRVEYVNEGGSEYIDFFYKIGERYSLKDRRFAVKKDNLHKMQRDGETLDQTEDRLKDESNRVLLHIADKFCTEDDINAIEGETFKEFAQGYVKLLNASAAGVKLYMKTIINKAGYVAAPKAGRFLQKMSTGSCALSYTKKELELLDKANNREGVAVEGDSSV